MSRSASRRVFSLLPNVSSPGPDVASPSDDPLPLAPTEGERTTGTMATDSLELSDDSVLPARRRRVRLPVILFVATCVSTFWVGASHWLPFPFPVPFEPVRAADADRSLDGRPRLHGMPDGRFC